MRRLQVIILLCAVLWLCTSCRQEAAPSTATTSPNTTITSGISGNPVATYDPESASKIANPLFPDDPYASVLNKLFSSLSKEELSSKHYALYDIDGDGTDELLLDRSILPWGGKNAGVPDAEKVFIFERLFTLRDGHPVELTESVTVYALWAYMGDLMAGRDVLSNGVIRGYGGSPDYTSYIYFKISDGDLKFLRVVQHYESEEYNYMQYIIRDGEETWEKISEDEFYLLRKEFEDDAEVVKLDWHPLTEYGK
ncbi:MAG: hypothetical protein IJK64_01025 [Clostridia bacterium]|nr:hypothetical protein [Clostridia bacterium]